MKKILACVGDTWLAVFLLLIAIATEAASEEGPNGCLETMGSVRVADSVSVAGKEWDVMGIHVPGDQVILRFGEEEIITTVTNFFPPAATVISQIAGHLERGEPLYGYQTDDGRYRVLHTWEGMCAAYTLPLPNEIS